MTSSVGDKLLGAVTGSIIKIVKLLAKILRSLPWIGMLKATKALLLLERALAPYPSSFK
jgi:hypothetical protein